MSKSRSAAQTTSTAPESLDAVRRRARHRLIGAAVLVLLGVVGFPLLFDTQPRPIAVDIPIEIPSRQAAKPTPAAAPAPFKPDATATVKDSLDEREQVVARTTPAAQPALAAAPAGAPAPAPAPASAPTPAAAEAPAKADSKAEPKSEPKAQAKADTPPPAVTPDAASEGARAQAVLEDKAEARIVVQVGAYAERARAQEVRLKLERAGLKTYTHVANTPDGERIRVRIGPYGTRAEAEKAADKVKGLGLPTAVLTL